MEPMLDPPKKVPDPYGWMRDESRSKEGEAYCHLLEKNAYTNHVTGHLQDLKEDLYLDLVSRVQKTDYTTPSPYRGYVYYSRTFEGKGYPVHCRAPLNAEFIWDETASHPVLDGKEQYLDENELAKDKEYSSTRQVEVSPSGDLVGYTLNTVGNEKYNLYIKDIASGETVHKLEGRDLDERLIWSNDDDSIFYVERDEMHRSFKVYQRTFSNNTFETFSNNTFEDVELFHEPNDMFWVSCYKSQDEQYLFIYTGSMETSEIWYYSLKDAQPELKCIQRRKEGVLYDAEHFHGSFLIVTNAGGEEAKNGRLLTAPVGQEVWTNITFNQEILFDGGPQRYCGYILPFQSHVSISGREDGLPQIWIISLDEQDPTTATSFTKVTYPESAYDVGFGPNYEFNADHVILFYDSMLTPPLSYKIPLDDPNDVEQRVILKKKNVPGYNPDLYATERANVLSRDNHTHIPISIVYRKSTQKGPTPTHLYGYGAYGSSLEAGFSYARLPLLDRGMVYVIAHVRGGGEMGRYWYEEPNGGKYLCKKNTFYDFVDVARWLIEEGRTSPEMLSCEGRSAGGLLIGASINLAPELFQVAILGVPFVDVMCTMIDSTIPLTAVEWEEWGNPNEVKFFDYMMDYSPINNVKEGAKYPSCLLTGGLYDPRVQFWEPAKFAAELRHSQGNDSGPVYLKMEMSAGHMSASDRYTYLKELSFDYAFLLDQLGLAS